MTAGKITSAECFHLTKYFNAFASRVQETGLPPLERITLVGARFTTEGLHPRDVAIMRSGVAYLLKSGIPVSEDFSVRPVNLEYGEDFLESQPSTDLLIFSYIFNANQHDWSKPQYYQRLEKSDDPGLYRLSPHHFRPDAWNHAAKNSGANIVISFGAPPRETTVDKLYKRDWLIAIRPGAVWRTDEIPEAHDMLQNGLFYHPSPQSFFAFALRRGGYLEKLEGVVSRETLLDRRIQECAGKEYSLLDWIADHFRLGYPTPYAKGITAKDFSNH